MRFPPLATVFGIVVLCALAIANATRTPRPRGADAPSGDFSADRAMMHVRELARAPRPVGSEGHERALIYIMSRIAALGLEPHIQATTGVGTRYPVAGRVRNILARIPGTRPSVGATAVLLVAHWDGVPAGPAAGDDASGVAVLLETLRAIRNGPIPSHDVVALFTDAEESGLLGAAAFAREHAWARDVAVILNFEARGTHGPSLMFETGAANYDVVSALRRAGGARATSLSTAIYRMLPNDTDLSELLTLNRPAMNFAFIGGVERYHTSEDDADHLSAGSLQHHGNQALELTRLFAGSRPLVGRARGDAVFFDLPLVGLVVYPEGWALPLALVAFVVCIALLIRVAQRRGADYLVAAAGAGMLLLSTAVSAAAAAGIAALLSSLHASLPWGGSPQWRGLYATALAFLTVAIVSSAAAVAARGARDRLRALEAGALVLLAAGAVLVTVAMPGVSFLFTWPVLVAGASAWLAATGPRAVARAARWLATAMIVFILAPIIYLMVCVALGLDVVGGGALAVLTAFGAWLLLSHLSEVSASPWRVALSASAAFAILIVAGIFTVRTDAARPAGAVFVYASDTVNGAWLAGGATNGWARAWVERELLSRRDSGRTGDPPAWLTRSFATRRIVPSTIISMPAPIATVVKDSTGSDSRIVTLRVRAPGALSIQLFSEQGVVLSARVDDREIRTDRYRAVAQRWRLEYVAPSDSGFVLSLALRPGDDNAIGLVAEHPGLPAGLRFPVRRRGIVSIGSGDATHVYRRVDLPDSRSTGDAGRARSR